MWQSSLEGLKCLLARSKPSNALFVSVCIHFAAKICRCLRIQRTEDVGVLSVLHTAHFAAAARHTDPEVAIRNTDLVEE